MLQGLVRSRPELLYVYAADGRGALHWAYEAGRADMVALLLHEGADPGARDANDQVPSDLGRARPPRQRRSSSSGSGGVTPISPDLLGAAEERADEEDAYDDDDDAYYDEGGGGGGADWLDSELTTMLWGSINALADQPDGGSSSPAVAEFLRSLESMTAEQVEKIVSLRSADGRGPLFWANEAGCRPLAAWLEGHGADSEARDMLGLRPGDLDALRVIEDEL